MDYRQKLMHATELLQRCSDGFGAYINGRKMARKERDALRRDIAAFLDGSRADGNATMRDLLLLARGARGTAVYRKALQDARSADQRRSGGRDGG